jgi:hypothetical protein
MYPQQEHRLAKVIYSFLAFNFRVQITSITIAIRVAIGYSNPVLTDGLFY